jgi:hypothetical protein
MTLEHDEMIEILEQIARNGGDAARIQAIKTLIRLQEGDNIDDDDLERLIRKK